MKNFLVRKIPQGDDFPVMSNDKDFQERDISQTWKKFPGLKVKDFRA